MSGFVLNLFKLRPGLPESILFIDLRHGKRDVYALLEEFDKG
jgi:hypothetical protein